MSEQSAVGVLVVGHGHSASSLLSAAREIVVQGTLDEVVALDAGPGETDTFANRMCDALDKVDAGRGVLLLVDLLGASPCECGRREGRAHHIVTLSGLNLAMLLKLSTLDRGALAAEDLARACASSAQRAVHVSDTSPKTTEQQ